MDSLDVEIRVAGLLRRVMLAGGIEGNGNGKRGVVEVGGFAYATCDVTVDD